MFFIVCFVNYGLLFEFVLGFGLFLIVFVVGVMGNRSNTATYGCGIKFNSLLLKL